MKLGKISSLSLLIDTFLKYKYQSLMKIQKRNNLIHQSYKIIKITTKLNLKAISNILTI